MIWRRDAVGELFLKEARAYCKYVVNREMGGKMEKQRDGTKEGSS